MNAAKVKHFLEWNGWRKTKNLSPKIFFDKIKTEKK